MSHLEKGLDEADVIVTTGGVSMGEKVGVVEEGTAGEGLVVGRGQWGGACSGRPRRKGLLLKR